MKSDDEKAPIVIKYQKLHRHSKGGIFDPRARKRLLGIARPYGGGSDPKEENRNTLSNFWNRNQDYVRSSLIDLELFIETGEKYVAEVINLETLKPVFDRIFVDPFNDTRHITDETGQEMIDWLEDPDIKKAELAKYLIKVSFNYLGNMQSNSITESNQNTIFEAYDLAKYLVEMFKPEAKREYKRDFVELR